MRLPPPHSIGAADLASALDALPDAPAVFLVRAGDSSAYLAKTGMLRRRLRRLFPPTEGARRTLDLRGVATSVDYWLTGSRLESALIHFLLAKRHYPDRYLQITKLRPPPYLRLNLENQFPRTAVTTRLGSAGSLYYGPFRSRAAAEQFEAGLLSLFQLRRCFPDLAPHPDHPGCIYGEMNLCLRPCQQVVGVDEYRGEVSRVGRFLEDNGLSLLAGVSASRDRLSEDMEFEGAAREHQRMEELAQVLAFRDGFAACIDAMRGVAIAPAAAGGLQLWFLWDGCWQDPVEFPLNSDRSLDIRLRGVVAELQPAVEPLKNRAEDLALLARWYFSSWRDGEWIPFGPSGDVPYRKLVRALSRVSKAAAAGRPETIA